MYLANKITKWLAKEGVIDSQDSELYDYGIQVFVITVIGWILALVLGVVFHVFIEAVVFYFAFSFIRKYAGGIHTKSFLSCFIISGITLTCVLQIIKYVPETMAMVLSIIFMLVATPYIALKSPVASPEKPLTEKDREEFRKIVRKRLVFILLIGITFLFVKLYTEALACSISLMLQGGSLLAFGISGSKKRWLKNISKA